MGKVIDIKDYVSDRVFDGVRPMSANRVAKLRAKYDPFAGQPTDPEYDQVQATLLQIFTMGDDSI